MERFNKEVRYYIPQKIPLTDNVMRQLLPIQETINVLPRKVLGNLSSYEYLFYVLSKQNSSLHFRHSVKNNLLHFKVESACFLFAFIENTAV
ncbi:MAG: hypothetical protein KatS3mg035_0948 [Bacteroidia bacterium]|nr:MAG: hypothetical protein KatS3mg035_0948 [Bacteroidia bacterium]